MAARISAPVLWMCICSSSGSVSCLPTLARSMACPPAMPREPEATASSFTICNCLVGIVAEAMLGQQLERQALQRIAHQQRSRFVVFDMAGRLAAAQHIVVHAGHVVMHQRIGVNQLDGGGGDIDALDRCTRQLACRISQQRTHALAAIQHAVAHGGMQALRHQFGLRQQTLQYIFKTGLVGRYPRGKIGHYQSLVRVARSSEIFQDAVFQHAHLLLRIIQPGTAE